MGVLARVEPMFWKASLLGAKIVRSGVVLTYSSREALTTAPPMAVRLNVGQVEMKFVGGIRKESREWTMPLSNLRS